MLVLPSQLFNILYQKHRQAARICPAGQEYSVISARKVAFSLCRRYHSSIKSEKHHTGGQLMIHAICKDEAFPARLKNFTGWTAEIIQHEIDHCDGILI